MNNELYFCPDCGYELQYEDEWYCPWCGQCWDEEKLKLVDGNL